MLTSEAHARPCASALVSTCINDDTLWPHAGPSQLLTVGGAETVASGQIAFGIVTTYLSRPIILHSPSPGPGGTDQLAINDQVNGNFLWAYGVTDRLELDLALPITFGQGGAGVQPITGGTPLQDTAVRDLRFGAAYALLPRARVAHDVHRSLAQLFGVAARFEVSAPTGNSDQFAGERAAVFVPSISADARSGRFFGGIEVGARLRPTAEIVGARIGSQLAFGAGAGFDILTGARDLLSVSIEARALPTFAEQHTSQQTRDGFSSTPNGSHITPAEWTAALRTSPLLGGDLGIQLGGGGAIPLGGESPITTPRFRFTLGIRYAPIARDSDGDGVLDRDDRCPREAGTRKAGGCPEASPVIEESKAASAGTIMGDESSRDPGIGDRRDPRPTATEDFAILADGFPERAVHNPRGR